MIGSPSGSKTFVPAAGVAAEKGIALTLVARVAAACSRLSAGGWDALLKQHGLNIAATDLRAELLRPLPHIDRTAPGFEDFAIEGCRGIEAGVPSRSLLFHRQQRRGPIRN